jgi:hypothetical protein
MGWLKTFHITVADAIMATGSHTFDDRCHRQECVLLLQLHFGYNNSYCSLKIVNRQIPETNFRDK